MSGIAFDSTELLTSKDQLIDHFAAGAKPEDQFKIGVEFEAFLYCKESLKRLQYDEGLVTIRQILDELRTRHGWQLVEENGKVISATDGASRIHFEPGGQIELSTHAYDNVCDVHYAMERYVENLAEIGKDLGFGMSLIGSWPKFFPTDTLIMARERYKILRQRILQAGSLGPEMMTNTACIHVNLDYKDEADMIRKFRVGLALQPFIGALCANSPFHGDEVKEDISYRQRIWQDTDGPRCDYLSFGFDDDMGFARYVDYAMSVPSIFVVRDNVFENTHFKPFQDIFDGKIGVDPIMADWENHLTTLFPSVRLKQYLELRGADVMPKLEEITALAAFWAGLFYDDQALGEIEAYLAHFSSDDFIGLDKVSPTIGLKSTFAGTTVQDVLIKAFDIATAGLNRRYPIGDCKNEVKILEPLRQIVESGESYAEKSKRDYTPETFQQYIWDHSVF